MTWHGFLNAVVWSWMVYAVWDEAHWHIRQFKAYCDNLYPPARPPDAPLN